MRGQQNQEGKDEGATLSLLRQRESKPTQRVLTGETSIPQASRSPPEVPLTTVSTRRYWWEGFSCLGLRTQLSEPFLLEGPRAVHCPSITWRDRGYPAVCSDTVKDIPDITRSHLRTVRISWLTLHGKELLGLCLDPFQRPGLRCCGVLCPPQHVSLPGNQVCPGTMPTAKH